jgi:hypothetical protein
MVTRHSFAGSEQAVFCQHRENKSHQDPIRFSQYAIDYWQYSQSEEYKDTEQYWINQFKENIPVLNMPLDWPRPPLRTYKSKREDFVMDQQLVSKVKQMGAKAGCSFVTTLLSAFEVLLYRFIDQN